jgi:UDP-glucuronate 4-epimerase
MPSNKPTALVTGASGFIGRQVAQHLADAGHAVTALDIREPDPSHAKEVRTVVSDIRDGDLPEGPFETIIHLAALGGVRPSTERPLDYVATNIGGTVRLLEWAKQRGVKRFIFASSSSVYGATDGTPSAEAAPLSPCSPYALTKVEGEQWGKLYAEKHGIDFIALRLFAVWGDGQRPDLALESFRRKILAGETITIHGDGSQRRDLTHVSDVARAVERAVDWEGSGFEVFNIGTGLNHSVNDMLRAAEAWNGMTTEVKYGPAHPADVPGTLADVRKTREVLGWEARVSFP